MTHPVVASAESNGVAATPPLGWRSWSSLPQQVSLKAGANTIQSSTAAGFAPDIDALTIG